MCANPEMTIDSVPSCILTCCSLEMHCATAGQVCESLPRAASIASQLTGTPPEMQTTRIYHPNVTDDGAICMGLLKSEAWKPSTKIEQSAFGKVSPKREKTMSLNTESLVFSPFPAVLRALVQLLQEPNRKYTPVSLTCVHAWAAR